MPEKGGIVLKRRFLLVWILIAAIAACASSALAQTPYDECLRFHVIAEDDSDAAQEMKLKLKDAVADRVVSLFAACDDPEEAWAVARANTDLIEAWARDAAEELGYRGSVSVETGICSYETRRIGSRVLPEGEYRSVRIVMGEGEGQNWWCLLYPELIMPEGYVPGMKVEFYSSVLRWLSDVFGGGDNG